MDKELPGGLRDVQVVLKELVNGKQGLLVQGVNGVLLKYLLEEHPAHHRGQLVDQATDAQVLIGDDGLLRVKDLAHVDGHPGLLVGPGQVPDVADHGADADGGLDLQVLGQGVLNALGNAVDLFAVAPLSEGLDDSDVRLVDGDDKILLAVGEQALDHVHRRDLRRAHLPDQKDRPEGLRGEVELLGTDVDIPQQDVVGDDGLHKGGLVVLLLIVGLGAVQGHRHHGADELGLLVTALDKGGIIVVGPPADQRFEGLVPVDHHGGLIHI